MYQWEKDGIVLQNSSASSLSLNNVNASNIGIYQSIVTGTCGTEASNTIYLYVQKRDYSREPEIFLWPSFTSSEFNVALSNNSIYNISIYTTNGRLISNLTNCRYQTTINVSTIAKGTYIIVVYNGSFRKSLKVIKE